MDWMTLAAAWGPAVPILFVLLRAHHDMIYKVFPGAINELKRAMARADKKAARRHVEHVQMQARICRALGEPATCATKKKKRRRAKRSASK